jgi:hypothetical protein
MQHISQSARDWDCAACLSAPLDVSTDTRHSVPKTVLPSTKLNICEDSLHPSPSFCTVLASGVECRVSVVSLVLVRVESGSGTAVFIQTRLLTEHWASVYFILSYILVILSRQLLKHTVACLTITTARSIISTCSFTQHSYHLWQSSQCTTYLKL